MEPACDNFPASLASALEQYRNAESEHQGLAVVHRTPVRERCLSPCSLDFFVCGHPKYVDLRTQIQSKGSNATLYVGTAVAAALGSAFGVTTAAILPTVLLLFHIAGKITLNAYCRNYNLNEEKD